MICYCSTDKLRLLFKVELATDALQVEERPPTPRSTVLLSGGWISKSSTRKAEKKAIQDERTKRLKELALKDQVVLTFKVLIFLLPLFTYLTPLSFSF